MEINPRTQTLFLRNANTNVGCLRPIFKKRKTQTKHYNLLKFIKYSEVTTLPLFITFSACLVEWILNTVERYNANRYKIIAIKRHAKLGLKNRFKTNPRFITRVEVGVHFFQNTDTLRSAP